MAAARAREASLGDLGLYGCLLISRLGGVSGPPLDFQTGHKSKQKVSVIDTVRVSVALKHRSPKNPNWSTNQSQLDRKMTLHNPQRAPRAQKDPMGTPDNVHIILLSPPWASQIISYAMLLGFIPFGGWSLETGLQLLDFVVCDLIALRSFVF